MFTTLEQYALAKITVFSFFITDVLAKNRRFLREGGSSSKADRGQAGRVWF